ncbi:uncharacterized protein NPIL_11191 [Nephila pilipes]|uniref:Spider venom protein n=1 Tax=Nephila pilipes TaxID=299642 RepID=A0A8X6QTV3_NEPPI|nr:uncharacterized protein NPIL_11191 [Nephila pilipes]
MISKTCALSAIAAILIMEGSLKYGICSTDVDKRTGWEPESGGGWAPPMPMPMHPPKIILIDNKESSNGGNQKEDKISMFLPVIMTLGPLIIMAIMMPIFMSLISGIMSFIKSLLSMKMPMMMPSVSMMMPMPMPMPMPTPTMPPELLFSLAPVVKPFPIIGRKNNDTDLDAWSTMNNFAFTNNATKMLDFGRGV